MSQSQYQPNTLAINCRCGAAPTPELVQEAARVFANVECRNVPNTQLTIDLNAFLPPQQPDVKGRPSMYYDRSQVQHVENLFAQVLHNSNVEEILSAQMGRPVHAWVRSVGRPR